MIKLGLQRTQDIVANLLPLQFKCIHVAGTNGKGSVSWFVAHLLANISANLRIGLYNSPGLSWPGEGIRLIYSSTLPTNDCYFQGQLSKTITRVTNLTRHDATITQNYLSETCGKIWQDASPFEKWTAIALRQFSMWKVNLAIMECGMGGCRDATNILSPNDTLVSVLTRFGRDHMHDLELTRYYELVREKAGIFKPACPWVVDISSPNSDPVLETLHSSPYWLPSSRRLGQLCLAHARKCGAAPGWIIDSVAASSLHMATSQAFSKIFLNKYIQSQYSDSPICADSFNLSTFLQYIRHIDNECYVKLISWPDFQLANLQTAVAVSYMALARLGYIINFDGMLKLIISTVKQITFLPARSQIIILPCSFRSTLAGCNVMRKLLLDGAHNVQAARELSRYLAKIYLRPPIVWIIGLSCRKVNDEAMISQFFKSLIRSGDSVILLQSIGESNSRTTGIPVDKLLALLKKAVVTNDSNQLMLNVWPVGPASWDNINRVFIALKKGWGGPWVSKQAYNIGLYKHCINLTDDTQMIMFPTDGQGPSDIVITGSLYLLGDVYSYMEANGNYI